MEDGSIFVTQKTLPFKKRGVNEISMGREWNAAKNAVKAVIRDY